MKYQLGILIILLLVVGYVVFTQKKEQENPMIVFEEISFDFNVVKQSSGLVTHDFPFIYTGTDTIMVTGLPTSCGCTSARIEPNVLTAGTKGIVKVIFDPNLHAEPQGRFYKTVNILTDPQIPNLPELKIWAEIDLDLGEEFYKEAGHEGKVLLETEDLSPEKDYRTISASTLKEAMEDKHFFLVDVHTPEQAHINGTDAVIAFDQIQNNLDKLPQNKNENVVLYCRSGSMSQQAAQTLVNLGYTNVYHMQGGIQAYNELK